MDTTLPPHPKFGRDNQGNLWLNFGAYGQQIEIACFTADGSRLLTVREVGLAQIWDTTIGQLIGQIRPDSPLAGSDRAPTTDPFEVFIEAASLSPDGTRALLGLNDGTAGIFDVASGQRIATLHDPEQPPASNWGVVRAVAYSLDGARVAVGFDGRAVGVWDGDGNAVAFLRDQLVTRPYTSWDGPRPALVSTVAFSSDSQILFAGAAESRPRSRPAAQLCLHAPIARCSAGIWRAGQSSTVQRSARSGTVFTHACWRTTLMAPSTFTG